MAQTRLYSHQQLMNDPTLFMGQVPLIAHGDSWFSFGDFFPTKTRSLLDFFQFGRDAGIVNYAMPGQKLKDYPNPQRYAKFHLAMPFDGHQFDVTEPILTQLGPRDMRWLQAVIKEPSLGRDIFPWWEDGHGAEYHLGRALCYMWNSLRWREPLTETEAELLETILRHLDSAYSLDPDLEFPWREWSQIIDFLGTNYELTDFVEEMADKSDLAFGRLSLVGYRRFDVRKNLGGGWSVAIPGTFVEELEEGQTFLAYDETRNVRVTCMSATDSSGNTLDAAEILRKIRVIDDPISYEKGKVLGRAFFEKIEEEDATFWMLRGVSAASGTFAQVTICFEEEDEQPWALSIWRSLDHRSSHET